MAPGALDVSEEVVAAVGLPHVPEILHEIQKVHPPRKSHLISSRSEPKITNFLLNVELCIIAPHKFVKRTMNNIICAVRKGSLSVFS